MPRNFTNTIKILKARAQKQDPWALSEALAAEMVWGDRYDWNALRVALQREGLDYSISSLKQYRDTAVRWTGQEKVPGVSYSAHRAALQIEARVREGTWPSVGFPPRELLLDLVKKWGAKNVTVAKVKKACSPPASVSAAQHEAGQRVQVDRERARQDSNLVLGLVTLARDVRKNQGDELPESEKVLLVGASKRPRDRKDLLALLSLMADTVRREGAEEVKQSDEGEISDGSDPKRRRGNVLI